MKRFSFFILWLSIPLSGFTLEFTVAPLYFIDETSERAVPQNNFHDKLISELGKEATGIELRFKKAVSSRYNPPQSVGDAITLCRTEQADYLIYGYIVRKEHTIQGELRLLDYERREVVASFFAMDGKDREDAFMGDLAGKILRFIQETYNIIIMPDPPAFTHIQFPVSLGYWLPFDRVWRDLLTGIIRIDGGVQIIPNDNVEIANGYIHFVSLGIDVSYRLGTGRYYKAWDHCFTVTAPIQIHRKINEQHEGYAGFGCMYSLDLLRIEKPYDDPETELFDAFGLMINAGWIFHLKEKVFFFVDARLEFKFYQQAMVSFSPSAGIILRPYSKEVVKKW
jgi:hypothetical protein